MVLRSLSIFETSYLTRCSNRLNESVAQAFSGGARTPPGINEGLTTARTITNELDSAKFDPVLAKSVAKNVVTALEQLVSRWDALVRLFLSFFGPVVLMLYAVRRP